MGIVEKPKAPFEKYLGMEILEKRADYAKVRLPFRKEFTNPHGTLHGGVIVSLADTAAAVAISSRYPEGVFYTVKMKAKFLESVSGEIILADAEVIEEKKKLVFVRVYVKNESGKLLAEVETVFYMVDAGRRE